MTKVGYCRGCGVHRTLRWPPWEPFYHAMSCAAGQAAAYSVIWEAAYCTGCGERETECICIQPEPYPDDDGWE